MYLSQFMQEPSSDYNVNRSRLGEPTDASPIATLMELGIAFANAPFSPSLPGQCAKCRSYRFAQSSTAQFPRIFCSEQCELAFVRATLARLTIEDCIRIHRRLEVLLDASREK
jgi:hypothetical protein